MPHTAQGLTAVVADDFDGGRSRAATEVLCVVIIESFELSFEMATPKIVPTQKCGMRKLWLSDG